MTIADDKSNAPRPITVSRFFAAGEIPNYAAAVINGSPVDTQCNVKTRWPDGSIQHALMTFWVRTGGGVQVSFANQSSGRPDGALKREQMLSDDYNFGALIELNNGTSTVTADARKMLADGAFSYWLQGPLCTQVIIAAPDSTYDLGWDVQPFHPIFVATFYPGWRGVKVEMIGEIAWMNKLQDLTYSLALRTGKVAGAPVYEKANYTHIAKSRWRKTFWAGEPLPAANVDYNLPYMIYSRALPNYDLNKRVSDATVNREAADFKKSDRGELEGRGNWIRDFPRAGGRPELGLFPRWVVRYLYTFRPELYEVMIANAEVGGYIPIHYRESDGNRYFDSAKSAKAQGRVVSIEARPTFSLIGGGGTTKADAFTVTGPVTTGGWIPDMAHQGSFAYVPYLITGDWYYLEEACFWAAYNLADVNSGSGFYGRNRAWGVLQGQIRAEAWGLRNLAHAAVLAPDQSPEKQYFTEKVLVNIAIREGKYDIRDGNFYDPKPNSYWHWGRNVAAQGISNPLMWVELPQRPKVNQPTILPGILYTSPWQDNFNRAIWGHLKELGFPIGPLLAGISRNLLNQILSPDFNRYLVASYQIPMGPALGVTYDSWAAVKSNFEPSTRDLTTWNVSTNPESYVYIAFGTSSFLPGVTDGPLNGADAWTWMRQNVPRQDVLNDDPRWAFVPRTEQTDERIGLRVKPR